MNSFIYVTWKGHKDIKTSSFRAISIMFFKSVKEMKNNSVLQTIKTNHEPEVG